MAVTVIMPLSVLEKHENKRRVAERNTMRRETWKQTQVRQAQMIDYGSCRRYSIEYGWRERQTREQR